MSIVTATVCLWKPFLQRPLQERQIFICTRKTKIYILSMLCARYPRPKISTLTGLSQNIIKHSRDKRTQRRRPYSVPTSDSEPLWPHIKPLWRK